jgi:ABC-2 type transport system ATP-binding protein
MHPAAPADIRHAPIADGRDWPRPAPARKLPAIRNRRNRAMSHPCLDIEDLSFRYGKAQALDRVSLALAPGRLLALLGPNGAGKTTLLSCLLGLLRPQAGHVRIFGHRPGSLPARRACGVMLQNSGVPELLSVEELVELFRSHHAEPFATAEVMALAGVEALAARRFGTLSGGQRQQVLFALAIVGRPRLLLLDEPTNGMDFEARARLWATVRGLRGEGVAVLLTTHYIEEAERLADEVVLLEGGRVLEQGAPAALRSRLAGSELRFRSALAPAQLAAVCPGAEVDGETGRYRVLAAEPERLLRRLLPADPALGELEVRPIGLADAMAALYRKEAA